MAFSKSDIGTGLDDNKINSHYDSLVSNNKKSASVSTGEDVKDIPHNKPSSGNSPTGPMNGNLMTWTKMLESMDMLLESISEIQRFESTDIMGDNINDQPLDAATEPAGSVDEQDLLNKLNEIFTPILVMQGFEGDISDKIQEAFEEASLLMERNIISFDSSTRMAQLISVCALLIAQQKNTAKFQMYKKAAAIRNQMKIDIQKDEYDEAKALAQKFLVKVSTTNNSSFARDAANDLLPETQH